MNDEQQAVLDRDHPWGHRAHRCQATVYRGAGQCVRRATHRRYVRTDAGTLDLDLCGIHRRLAGQYGLPKPA